ncbi:hypothetical protein P0Y35_05685 [Kiritimatiellaeota bacterium B1221]|nr:hypothetical protein [Kiritimatiellaeota bacterium B1221]
MSTKRISILYLILFTWNTLFGAVGGLLICIHEDFHFHSQVAPKLDAHCETVHAPHAPSPALVASEKNCLDIELDAAQTLLVKPEHTDFTPLLNYPLLVEVWNFDSLITLRELAPALHAQAPPEQTADSVHIVQLTQLRI